MAAEDLFPDAPRLQLAPSRPDRARQALRARLVPETDCWTVEDHICRFCMGRIVSRVADPKRRFMCSCCGHAQEGTARTAEGRLHPPFCACSIRYGPRDAGIRCEVNDDPTPEAPMAVVARQVL
jgi:ribosomal protein L37AE/L43A